MGSCPVCRQALSVDRKPGDYADKLYFDCSVCGMYGITRSALKAFEQAVAKKPSLRFGVSHYIRDALSGYRAPSLDTFVFDQPQFGAVLDFLTTPTLREQADNLIRWLGEQTHDDPAAIVEIDSRKLASVMAAASEESPGRVVQHLIDEGLISGRLWGGGGADAGLTFPGWDRYDELQRSHSEGPIAFMAMAFGDPPIDDAYRKCFKLAVSQCGFDLRRIDEKPPAGLIDNRMRVEIRRSRFLVVDLTHDNRGAYWEAGFAEGLGKPVIYTCEASVFAGTHFDTNHQHTILWTQQSLDDAGSRLKDTIRATLPSEAKMFD